MGARYYCRGSKRLEAVRDHKTLNGIEYLEVVDSAATGEDLRQRTLLVQCLKTVPQLSGENVRIEGGVRAQGIRVLWACRAADLAERVTTEDILQPEKVLVVRTDAPGDFSAYRLRLVAGANTDAPPADFDPRLATVEFSFKAQCPTELDCLAPVECPPEPSQAQAPIDYLAKDYASFRRLMLDRLAVTLPDWTERSPADVGVAIVETLAHAADQLSYYQDAVATEAYLGTARRRTSVRRHARLLDYRMHEGCNARVWVQVQVQDQDQVKEPVILPEHTPLLTRTGGLSPRIDPGSADYAEALARSPVVFETQHQARLAPAHNEPIPFYTWSDEACCLPQGATRATLRDDPEKRLRLRPGDVLILEEERGPASGLAADADPAHRHAVRLTRVHPAAAEEDLTPGAMHTDPLTGEGVVEIEWHAADALPFSLCLSKMVDGEPVEDMGVAWANVVLADHGRTVGEDLDIPDQGRFRLRLAETDLTFRRQYGTISDSGPAVKVVDQDARQARAAVELRGDSEVWEARPDLLGSDRYDRHFVVEMDEERRAWLRFGDGVLGRRPEPGELRAVYRVGNGRDGNVGAESIAHVVTADSRVLGAQNRMFASGGRDPEPMDEVRLYAPQAFRTQQRAVTDADYAAAAQRHPEVQRAVATRRWTGSWHTLFITVDRRGSRPVDAAFEAELVHFLEPFRLVGHDLEIAPAVPVPLDIALRVCVEAGTYRATVLQRLLTVFSNRELPNGERGFFHPDRLILGQPVYLSPLVAAAMRVAGVRWVQAVRFHRRGQSASDEIREGRIPIWRDEVARLDNDPSAHENGTIELLMEGGL